MQVTDQYAEYMGKLLAGEITPEERTQLMDWVHADPAHQKFFEDVQNLWQLTQQYSPEPLLDAPAAWARLDAATPATPPAHKARRIWLRVGLRVAAAVLLLLAGWWWQQNSRATVPVHEPYLAVFTDVDERCAWTLPDGSVVHLNQSSSLVFREYDTLRLATLSGEAFFEVAHQAAKPFVILAGGSRTTVLGTSFNVRAYPHENEVQVSVVSGRVQVQSLSQPTSRVVLQARETAAVEPTTGLVVPTTAPTANAAAWLSRRLVFDNTPMTEVAAELKRYFHRPIRLASTAVGQCRFSGTFEEPKLQEVLQTLAFSMDLQLEQRDTVLILKGAGCPR